MSRYICYITRMSRGKSGRIVIEVDPAMKRRLYASLALSGSTLKDWFVGHASGYIDGQEQTPLSVGSTRATKKTIKYKSQKNPKT